MNWQSFGRQLIVSEDLDPVYVLLHRAELESGLLKRWCLAYWCFYDCGTASRIAESNDFWMACQRAYDEKWSRGSERRHFRGQQCLDSLASLRNYGTAEQIVESLTSWTEFSTLANAVRAFKGFGPWITWKIADMLERVLHVPLSFTDASLAMYSEPVAGAAIILGKQDSISPEEMEYVLSEMSIEFKDLLAPPHYDRPLNVQEYETVLCKYKSHTKGHYPVGHDILQITTSLWRARDHSDLSKRLMDFLPTIPEGVVSLL